MRGRVENTFKPNEDSPEFYKTIKDLPSIILLVRVSIVGIQVAGRSASRDIRVLE